MQHRDRAHKVSLWLLASFALASFATRAQAQVVPDTTLGNGNNSVTSTTGNRTDITGGAGRGSALFHSFERFNISPNEQVYFANPTSIRNIFSRVTGGSLSNIDGLLGVAGSANLFFMNPSGIIFGPNARLDVSGSFLATTANALEFPDNQKFAATGDRAVPLVEVNLPIGLQFGANPPAMLTNRGNLAVEVGQSLTLAGGNTTNTGSLTAPGGTVQVLGQQVALLDNSQIDVSSVIGGGTVLVGGDYQGRGSLLNAQSTIVGQDAVIKADALVNGNGGKVIVWSDGDTRYNGTISAQGGVQGGNGGFVEVSGKQRLAFQGQVDTRAFLGQAGTLLLDPDTINIVTGGAGTLPDPIPADGGLDLSPAAINAALTNGNLVLQANQSITISNAINFTGNANSLTFTANDNIFLNASVTTNGAQIYNSAVTIGTPTATLTTTNSDITFNNTVNSAASANNSLTIAAGTGTANFANDVGTDTNAALGNLNITSNAVQLNTTNVTNNLAINAGGAITQNGDLTVGETTTLAAGANDITLNGANNFNTVQITSGNNVELNNASALNLGTSNITGTLDITTDGAITQSGNLIVGSTTTLAAGNANDITLTGANNFNTVQINSGNNVSLNDVNNINIGTSNVAGNLNVTGSTINVPNGAIVNSADGDITLNGTTSVTNSGSLVASERSIDILGGQILLPGGSTIDVSGSTGGTVQINGSQVGIAANARINADSTTNGAGGTITVTVPDPLNAIIIRTATNITADGTPAGTVTLPDSAATAILGSFPTTADPNTSAFNDITIVDGNGQSIITALQGSINPFIQPFLQNDPLLYQFYAGTLFQNLQIPQTALEGAPSVLSGLLTGSNIILAARNNITVQDLTNQGAVPNQLTLTPSIAAGSIQLAAGGVFTMNQGDTIQTNGRSIQITALNPSGVGNSLTIGGINASSPLTVGGDISLTAANGNIAIGNGINPTSISSNSVGNIVIQTLPARSFSRVQVEATGGSVNLNNVQIQADSDTGYAGRVSINAANTITAINQTTVNANGQFGNIEIGSLLSSPTIPALRPNNILLSATQLSAENNLISLPGGGLLTAGAIQLGANNSVQVINSELSSSASGNATAGAVEIQTTSNSSGLISLTNSTLRSEATGSGEAGVINLIDANTIALNGTTISNTVVNGAGGKTTISGGTIAIAGSSTIRADTSGQGRAGEIDVTTENNGNISITGNSQISARSRATGANSGGAGSVSLAAGNNTITIDSSAISNEVVDGTGDNIAIDAGVVALQNGAKVNASTSGNGAAGEIAITATAPNPNPTTAALTIANSQVQASSSGQGTAGAVSLEVPDGDIAIRSSSSVSSGTSGDGNSGSVTIAGQNLSITGGSVVRARSDGAGAPGSISVDIANTLAVSGTNASGQISEISTFSGTAANLSNPDVGNIRINQPGSLVRTLELSERGRINASTQSTNSTFTGGNIQVYADNLRISSGGQVVASSLDDGNAATAQAGAGSISIISNSVDISGSKQSFVSDPAFQNAVSLKRVGTINEENGILLTTSGGAPASSLASGLGLANLNGLTNPTNGSGIQLSVLNNLPGTLSFNWTFLTSEATGFPASPFNDASFVAGNNAPVTPLADANTGNFVASSPISGFSSATIASPSVIRPIGQGNVVNIGVVNAGDTAVDSGLRVSNLTLNGQPAQVLVNSPDIDPTEPFISGIFARADGTGNAGSVTITGAGAAANVVLSDKAQISTSTDRGGLSAPSNIKLQGLQTLTVTNSLLSSSTNSGTAGSVEVNATEQVLLDGTFTDSNGSVTGGVTAIATQGGNAGSISLVTPTLDIANGAAVAVSSANGTGTAGNVEITANTVTLNNAAQILAETDAGGAGSPADIKLQGLQTLTVTNSLLSSSTNSGTAGSVEVNATEQVLLDGTFTDSNGSVTGGVTAIATQGGNAGSISLVTPTLDIANGAAVAVSSANGAGTAGNVEITANTVTLNNAAQILAETDAGGAGSPANINLQGLTSLQLNNAQISALTQTGQAGSVDVNASGNIDLTNGSQVTVEANGANGVAGNITITGADISLLGGASRSRISTLATGENASAGNVTLNAIGGSVTLQNSDVIASSQQGASGNISITARRADLKNGTIKAETGQNTPGSTTGSIKLDLSFRLTLEDESEISTLGRNGANGGDITIENVRFLFGKFPTGANGSDIVGRADGGGQGGKVFLGSSTLVAGFLFRKAEDGNRTNDIDTNGQLANFSTDADVASRGLSTPLIVFTDVSQLNKSACEAVGAKATVNSELRIAGQGGVTLSPTAPLPAQQTSSDWVSLDVSPQVQTNVTFSNGATVTLQPGQTYQVQATCVKSWQEQQRSLL